LAVLLVEKRVALTVDLTVDLKVEKKAETLVPSKAVNLVVNWAALMDD